MVDTIAAPALDLAGTAPSFAPTPQPDAADAQPTTQLTPQEVAPLPEQTPSLPDVDPALAGEEVSTPTATDETGTIEPPAIETEQDLTDQILTPEFSVPAPTEPAPTVEQDTEPQIVGTQLENVPLQVNGTDNFAALGRSVARNEQNFLQRTQSFQNADAKQKRPLNRRETTQDHFNVTTTPVDGSGNRIVTLQTVGGVANGQMVGRSQPQQVRMSNKQLASTTKDVTAYAARYNNLDSFAQTTGALALLYNNVNRYIPAAVIPGQQTIGNVVNSFNLLAQWDNMSNASRARRTGQQIVQTARNLGYPLPQQATAGLGLLGLGFSAYQLLDNWENMNEAQRSVAAFNTIYSGAQAYNAGSALISGASSAGTTGTAVAGSTGGTAGASAGAAGGTTGATTGTAAVSGQQASTGILGSGVTWQNALTYAAAILGAYNIVTTWGEGGNAEGRVNGAANGAAVGSVFGPWGAAIGAVVGVAVGSISTGKSVEQDKRDAYRNHYEKNKVFERIDGSHHIQLADGSFYDVGQDGSDSRALHGGEIKGYANPDQVASDLGAAPEGKLRPYEVDFTNDLDFVTHLATKGLNLILNGGSIDERGASEAGQMNGYLTNAATSNTGRELNKENFTKSMANVRQFYSKLGITSKAQGIGVINALRQADRITQDDFNAIMFGLEFAFSENFETAQNLMKQLGRDNPVIPEDNITIPREPTQAELDQQADQGGTLQTEDEVTQPTTNGFIAG